MNNILSQAKSLAYRMWLKQLDYIRSRSKCKDYGDNDTIETIWNKLPKVSQEFWINRVKEF